MSWIKNIPIAHRGLHNKHDAPENSYAAFQLAISFKLPIEIDLRISSDNKIIVFHDENLERMTGDKNLVGETSWNQIKNLRLKETEEQIPLFTEFLEFINGQVPILLEIKNFQKPGDFEKQLLIDLKNYKGDLAIQSFNPLSIRWLKINAPDMLRGQIASRFKDYKIPKHQKNLLQNLTFNISSRPHFINYKIDDLPYFPVSFFKSVRVPILGWTVKNRAQLEKAKKFCDNFVFENLNPAEIVQ